MPASNELALKALTYFYINQETKGIFQFEIVLITLITLHLNTYVISLLPFWMFDFFSAGIDFRRHNLTSIDVRFWRVKSLPALEGLNM